jgi:hypothetical protein
MDTSPEYPDPRISYGKPPDNVNLGRGPIGQYLLATSSPPEVSSNGRIDRLVQVMI